MRRYQDLSHDTYHHVQRLTKAGEFDGHQAARTVLIHFAMNLANVDDPERGLERGCTMRSMISQTAIAKSTGLAEGTASKAMTWLTLQGFIRVRREFQGKKQRTTRVQIVSFDAESEADRKAWLLSQEILPEGAVRSNLVIAPTLPEEGSGENLDQPEFPGAEPSTLPAEGSILPEEGSTLPDVIVKKELLKKNLETSKEQDHDLCGDSVPTPLPGAASAPLDPKPSPATSAAPATGSAGLRDYYLWHRVAGTWSYTGETTTAASSQACPSRWGLRKRDPDWRWLSRQAHLEDLEAQQAGDGPETLPRRRQVRRTA